MTSYRSHDNGNERGEDQTSEMRLARLGSERYQVSPAAVTGGGRGPWAVGRKLADLVEHSSFCVVISSVADSRLFAQAVVTPGTPPRGRVECLLCDTDEELTDG
jgi:hypothetical protein